ncbi:RES family NAD+ phosphorylase [Salinicola sp. MH3R3-1]|uniref:RES family NAD+ phosphorylase n=1 Tax=Salinicola sp. MH3R3-1 TaxID=1928762 RepID=UPI001FEE462F|nr:RES family NAD+ phosphorylase [Salinicola sp. MH3R3-1]
MADEKEFDALHQLQALTNPRLQAETGDLGLIDREDIPFGIAGCSYAVAPFTHLNTSGSRFSDGSFGVLYLADCLDTAIAEVRHHQQVYWHNVPDLDFDRFVFRELVCEFSEAELLDLCQLPLVDPIFAPNDYTASRALGAAASAQKIPGIRYPSVRQEDTRCWGLMTPRYVRSIVQSSHLEMIWNQGVTAVNIVSQP